MRIPFWFIYPFLALLLCGCATRPFFSPAERVLIEQGAICRGPTDRKQLALIFTGHEFAESAELILEALTERSVRASFFLTGDFLRNPAFAPLVRRMIREGHYVGPHSDKHLLYCSWESSRSTLVTRDEFRADLSANIAKLESLGLPRSEIPLFLPPYEHYNTEIAQWTREMGLTLINYSYGTRSNADYTEESAPNFVSSESIFDSIIRRAQNDPHGLNGFLLLLHLGAGPRRTDKFHSRFCELLDFLRGNGYELVRADALLRAR